MRQNLLAVMIGSALLAGATGASAALLNQNLSAPGAVVVPNGDPVLYVQLDSPTGNGRPDQNFESVYDAYDSEQADDFVVPAGPDNWSVTQVFTPGAYTNGGIPGGPAGPAASVSITFYADNAGVPGAAVCSYPGLAPVDNLGSFFVDLPTPCVLAPGNYWLSLQANQDVLSAGQHFGSTRSVVSNAPAVWRNPGDGFGTGCTGFDTFTNCFGDPPTDLLFQINGNLVAAPVLVPPAIIPTLSALGLLTLALGIGGFAWFRARHSV